MVGRSKTNAFQSLKNRIWKRIQGWKDKLLSKGGKEILTKVVAQAIPTYSMACFKIPISLCSKLKAMMARFWWGNQTDASQIHWISWQKLYQAKKEGGMGFKDLHTFNMAMLTKQGWRIMIYQFQESLKLVIFLMDHLWTHKLEKTHHLHGGSYWKEGKHWRRCSLESRK